RPFGRHFSDRDSHVGKPGPSASAAHCQQISALLTGRCSPTEASKFFAEGPRHERAGNCADAQARWSRATTERWSCWRSGCAPAPVASEKRRITSDCGESRWYFCWISERVGTLADERVRSHVAQVGAVLQNQHS